MPAGSTEASGRHLAHLLDRLLLLDGGPGWDLELEQLVREAFVARDLLYGKSGRTFPARFPIAETDWSLFPVEPNRMDAVRSASFSQACEEDPFCPCRSAGGHL
jgi:hypothetical protein